MANGKLVHNSGKLNQQNLPRVSGKPTDALRKSLRAPAGRKVVVVDLSGIELRVNHFLWNAKSSTELFIADPEKADLYKDFASKLYNVPVAEVTKAQRQIGKIAHLGLGFGSGPQTFIRIAKTMGGVTMSEAEAIDVVKRWRTEYNAIRKGWAMCNTALVYLYNKEYGKTLDLWGMCVTHEEGIKTPVGMIRYPALEYDEGDKQFWYGEGRNRARLHGPLVDENLVQHLARCIMAEQMLSIAAKFDVVHTVHDEVVCIVEEDRAQECLDFMLSTMRTPPTWWPELVLWAEGDIADSYGEAK
jgi:DNA polymerase